MTREEFKMISLGNYVLTRRGETIDQRNLEAYSEGAMFAYDQLQKRKTQDKQKEQEIKECQKLQILEQA